MKSTWNELIIRASSIARVRMVYGDNLADYEVARRRATRPQRKGTAKVETARASAPVPVPAVRDA